MRISVVGAGAWGKNIVRTLYEIGVLGDVVELSSDVRKDLAEHYPDLRLHDSIAPILKDDVPAVCIATPVPTHYELAKVFLEEEKDVFVEKPMTLSVDDAAELVRIAEERERVLMVGHLLLYQPAVQWIKQAVKSQVIGDLRGIHQRRLGLGRARSVENVLWSLGVHDVAVALYLAGNAPLELDVSGQRLLQPEIEDDVHLHMVFANGVETYLHCSWLWPEKDRGMVVIGSEGMLVYNEIDQTVKLHRKRIDSGLNNVDEGVELVYEGKGQPLRLELEHFMDCVARRIKPVSDGQSGLDVIRVLQKASERLRK